MKIKYRNSFLKDIKKVHTKREKELIKRIIENIKSASNPTEIKHFEKLSDYKYFFKIKVQPYRIGIYLDNDVIELVRFGHRKDFYKYFPPK
jgi:mRNA interferase RelE/StbE